MSEWSLNDDDGCVEVGVDIFSLSEGPEQIKIEPEGIVGEWWWWGAGEERWNLKEVKKEGRTLDCAQRQRFPAERQEKESHLGKESRATQQQRQLLLKPTAPLKVAAVR